MELTPLNAEVYLSLSLAYRNLGDFQLALDMNDSALKLGANKVNALIARSGIFNAMNHIPEAIKYLDQALEIDKQSYVALNNRSDILSKQGNYKAAILDLKTADKIAPNQLIIMRNLGINLSKLGFINEAMQYFIKSLKIDPKNYETILLLAVTFNANGNYEAAIKYFDSALKIADDPQTHYLKGVSFLNRFLYNEALDEFSYVYRVNSANVENIILLFITNLISGKETDNFKLIHDIDSSNPSYIGIDYDIEKLKLYFSTAANSTNVSDSDNIYFSKNMCKNYTYAGLIYKIRKSTAAAREQFNLARQLCNKMSPEFSLSISNLKRL